MLSNFIVKSSTVTESYFEFWLLPENPEHLVLELYSIIPTSALSIRKQTVISYDEDTSLAFDTQTGMWVFSGNIPVPDLYIELYTYCMNSI